MTITTGINIYQASTVVVEAHEVVNQNGGVTKWLTFSVKDAENDEAQSFTVFDVELNDLLIKQALKTTYAVTVEENAA